MCLRTPTLLLLSLAVCTCNVPAPPGPPVRLVAGAAGAADAEEAAEAAEAADTIVVNSRWPTALPVRALDAAGRAVAAAPIRYEREGGAPLPVAPAGAVTCARAGDLTVRATLGRLPPRRLVVRCRPVAHVRIPGPLQFILGDSAYTRPYALPVTAYGPDGRPVHLVVGRVSVGDTAIATLRGLTLHPRARGITQAGAHIGDGSAAMGVHVYQRVDTLGALDTLLRVRPAQRLFAVPLRLARGELRRQRLPPGGWMLAMLPEAERGPTGIGLRVEGAACHPNFLNAPRRFGCEAGPDASVVVYRPFGSERDSVATGYLLVRWLFR
jgi:hypothetical protein